MADSRTWEEFVHDNEYAAFIQNGKFCPNFVRDADPEVLLLLSNEKVPEWKKTGFNGCWSCATYSCDQNPMHEMALKKICKHCKYFGSGDKHRPATYCDHPSLDWAVECFDAWINVNEDDFCSSFEMKE